MANGFPQKRTDAGGSDVLHYVVDTTEQFWRSRHPSDDASLLSHWFVT
jgi:hypothetical protein